jgi:hypothetical protein
MFRVASAADLPDHGFDHPGEHRQLVALLRELRGGAGLTQEDSRTDSSATNPGSACSNPAAAAAQRDRASRDLSRVVGRPLRKSVAQAFVDGLLVVGRRTVKPTFRVLPGVPTAPDATAAEPGGSAGDRC